MFDVVASEVIVPDVDVPDDVVPGVVVADVVDVLHFDDADDAVADYVADGFDGVAVAEVELSEDVGVEVDPAVTVVKDGFLVGALD